MVLRVGISIDTVTVPVASAGELLLREAFFLNDVSPTFVNASANRFNPYNKTFVGANVRRRRPVFAGSAAYQMDLIEGARTNMFTQSDLANGLADVPANSGLVSAVSTFGGIPTTTGIAFGYDGSTLSLAYKANATVVVSTTYSMSVFVKMADGNAPVFGGDANSGTSTFAFVIGGDAYNSAVKVESLGNGIFRCSITVTLPGGITSAVNNGIVKYSTNDNRTFIVTGYQLEAAPFASSYIPTTTVAVTRDADDLSTTLDSLAGGALSTTEGTIVCVTSTYGWKDAELSPFFLWGSVGDYATYGANNSAFSFAGDRRDTVGAHYSPMFRNTPSVEGVLTPTSLLWDATSVRGFGNDIISTHGTAPTLPYDAVTAMTIGRHSLLPTQNFHGFVGIFYFPRALSATEVAAVHAALAI
jgi:hypothetical protein